MRSVFTVNLPASTDGKYPSNSDVLSLVRSFGWEPTEVHLAGDETAKEQKYKELAENIFHSMPEIAAAEKDFVIFYGYFADDQTRFVITRVVEGQITFRLLHPELPRLQSSTEKMVRNIITSRIHDKILVVSNHTIRVYERGYDEIIMKGRVIPNAWREAVKTDRKDVLLAIGAFVVGFITLAGILSQISNSTLINGTMERMSTAMMTTALVSALGLFQAYWEISRHSIIAWTATNESTN
jgi:hypothetical protein